MYTNTNTTSNSTYKMRRTASPGRARGPGGRAGAMLYYTILTKVYYTILYYAILLPSMAIYKIL